MKVKKRNMIFISVFLLLFLCMVVLIHHLRTENQKLKDESNFFRQLFHAQASAAQVDLAQQAESGVQQNGGLKVAGGQLTNSEGQPLQLRGMSSDGATWYPEYTNYSAIRTTKNYGANLFRAAMYFDDAPGGYNYDETTAEFGKTILYTAIENALAADMYVIADWHLLEDQNLLVQTDSAIQFFDELSARYTHEPGVIYEICNGPNGDTTWEDIQTYAEQVIPVIRANTPDAVIIVGTPQFSSDLWPVMKQPLSYENILYAYHYYSGQSYCGFQEVLDAAKQEGLPVFVSEWGISKDEATGTLQTDAALDFIAYMKENNVSWASRALCNNDEDYSVIRSDVEKLSGWSMEDLTETGKIVFKALGGS